MVGDTRFGDWEQAGRADKTAETFIHYGRKVKFILARQTPGTRWRRIEMMRWWYGHNYTPLGRPFSCATLHSRLVFFKPFAYLFLIVWCSRNLNKRRGPRCTEEGKNNAASVGMRSDGRLSCRRMGMAMPGSAVDIINHMRFRTITKQDLLCTSGKVCPFITMARLTLGWFYFVYYLFPAIVSLSLLFLSHSGSCSIGRRLRVAVSIKKLMKWPSPNE